MCPIVSWSNSLCASFLLFMTLCILGIGFSDNQSTHFASFALIKDNFVCV